MLYARDTRDQCQREENVVQRIERKQLWAWSKTSLKLIFWRSPSWVIKMDHESMLLAAINEKLQETIEKMRWGILPIYVLCEIDSIWKQHSLTSWWIFQARQNRRDETTTKLVDALWHGLWLHWVPLQRLCTPSSATGWISSPISVLRSHHFRITN